MKTIAKVYILPQSTKVPQRLYEGTFPGDTSGKLHSGGSTSPHCPGKGGPFIQSQLKRLPLPHFLLWWFSGMWNWGWTLKYDLIAIFSCIFTLFLRHCSTPVTWAPWVCSVVIWTWPTWSEGRIEITIIKMTFYLAFTKNFPFTRHYAKFIGIYHMSWSQ